MRNTCTNTVRARIDTETKEQAIAALHDMGLSMSDGIRLFLHRVAKEQKMPFEIKVPNKATHAAMVELESGKSPSFSSVDALMDDLRADD